MSAEVQNKKYCQTSNANGSTGQNGHSHQNSILCDRCNQNQELKLAEMKKFEASFNVVVLTLFTIRFNRKLGFLSFLKIQNDKFVYLILRTILNFFF